MKVSFRISRVASRVRLMQVRRCKVLWRDVNTAACVCVLRFRVIYVDTHCPHPNANTRTRPSIVACADYTQVCSTGEVCTHSERVYCFHTPMRQIKRRTTETHSYSNTTARTAKRSHNVFLMDTHTHTHTIACTANIQSHYVTHQITFCDVMY